MSEIIKNNIHVYSYSVFESRQIKNIISALKNNYCEFYYKKQNGKTRHAFGTLKPEFLKEVWEPSEVKTNDDNDNIVYWDIVKKNFRQFDVSDFIELTHTESNIKDFEEKYPELEKKLKGIDIKPKKIKKDDTTKEEQ